MLIRRVGRRSLLASGAALGAGAVLAACAAPAAPTATTAPAKPAEAPKPAAEPTKPAAAPAPAAAATNTPAPAAAAPTKPAEAPKPAEPTKPAAAPAAGAAAPGTVKVLYWQAPTILNAHVATGTKDAHASRIFLEPLISYNATGERIAVLAAEVPSKANGGISEDGKTITYKLKSGLKWGDGAPFTANDVVFTWQFVTNKETAATTYDSYDPIEKVEAVDPVTAKITFKNAAPGWFVPFAGESGGILPQHVLKDYVGAKAKEAPWNTKPFGTGPFLVDDFKSGDLVIYKKNPNYRDVSKVAFDRIELKGGGDAVSAARAVFQTGEYDFAWNLQVEAAVLEQIAAGGKGDMLTVGGVGVEQVYFNMTDPNTEVEGEKSSPKSKHPFLGDKKVRQALAMAIDKQTMAKQLYGPTGDPTPNILTTPSNFNSKNTKDVFSIEEANKMLDEAGYKKGANNMRTTPDGKPMKVVFATSINTLRQKEQALIKDGWAKIGVDTELKSVDAGVYFDAKPGNPDSINKMPWDVMMFTSTFTTPFPSAYMRAWYSGNPSRDLAQKSNDWSGGNRQKWINAEYNTHFDNALKELDPAKQQDLFIKMNDLLFNDYAVIALIDRKRVSAAAKTLKGPKLIQFESDIWNIAEWTKA